MDHLIEICELYGKARKYLEEEYKNDPETEPYKSKYVAINYLKQIKDKLLDLLSIDNDDLKLKAKGMLSVTNLLLGTVSIDTEEMSAGEKFLNESLHLIDDFENPKYILLALTARNQLGILWCQRGETEKAKMYLEECEHLYDAFSKKGMSELTWSFHDYFETSNETMGPKGSDELEKVHTLTKFYLAQIYGKLGDTMKSAVYCHETLRRQLESKQYDHVDWALNAATLSQFFMERKLFKQARHHLAAASYMLDKYEDSLQAMELSEDEAEAKKEELRHRGADVSRCWAKFGIFLLEQSKDNEDVVEIVENQNTNLEDCWFSTLELASYESQMTDEPVTSFEAARDIMLVTQKFLVSAKEYYSLENHASDYVQIVQDHSTIIRHLSWFEKDEGRLCKMLKKRINMIEDVLKELNPQYYMNVCRALWFELGESFHDLMHIKQTKIRESDLPNPAALTKANQLAESSIRNFKLFLDSVKDKQDRYPNPLPEDLLRPTLVAHFFLGRLYYKLITPDKRQALKNTHEAFLCFKFLVDYCNEHPKGMSAVIDEFQVSEEMMNLLEIKMKQSVNILS